jgi:sugar lactone lactonase YvrE
MRLLFTFWLVFSCGMAGAQNISTFAGMGIGSGGFSGDGGLATAAHIGGPTEGAFDKSGNFYFSIRTGHRVRKISPSGIITTVAGTGGAGYNGDGIIATSAQLNNPVDVAVDTFGNLYIADKDNQRIRKIDAISGIITTHVGTGSAGFSGDGGPATSALLYNPNSICFDCFNNLFIADVYNHRIRKVNTSGIISTVAGNGVYGYSSDGGPADTTMLNFPWGIASDSLGNLYIADNGNYRIRKVSMSTGIISTIAGNGVGSYNGEGLSATSAQFVPYSIAFDNSGNLYIADKANQRARVLTPGGVINTVAGTGVSGFSGDGGLATLAQLYNPESVAVDACGNLYISDLQNQRIRKVTFNPSTTPTISITGTTTAAIGSTVTVSAAVSGAGSSYSIKWMNKGVIFATTTVPAVTYTKAMAVDSITGRVIPTVIYCYDSTTSPLHVVTKSTVGINEVKAYTASIHPNPATTGLSVTASGKIETITITNLLGQTVLTQSCTASAERVDVSALPAGVYAVMVTGAYGEKVVVRMVKE